MKKNRAVAETLAIRVYNYFIMSLIPGQVLPHEVLKPFTYERLAHTGLDLRHSISLIDNRPLSINEHP